MMTVLNSQSGELTFLPFLSQSHQPHVPSHSKPPPFLTLVRTPQLPSAATAAAAAAAAATSVMHQYQQQQQQQQQLHQASSIPLMSMSLPLSHHHSRFPPPLLPSNPTIPPRPHTNTLSQQPQYHTPTVSERGIHTSASTAFTTKRTSPDVLEHTNSKKSRTDESTCTSKANIAHDNSNINDASSDRGIYGSTTTDCTTIRSRPHGLEHVNFNNVHILKSKASIAQYESNTRDASFMNANTTNESKTDDKALVEHLHVDVGDNRMTSPVAAHVTHVDSYNKHHCGDKVYDNNIKNRITVKHESENNSEIKVENSSLRNVKHSACQQNFKVVSPKTRLSPQNVFIECERNHRQGEHVSLTTVCGSDELLASNETMEDVDVVGGKVEDFLTISGQSENKEDVHIERHSKPHENSTRSPRQLEPDSTLDVKPEDKSKYLNVQTVDNDYKCTTLKNRADKLLRHSIAAILDMNKNSNRVDGHLSNYESPRIKSEKEATKQDRKLSSFVEAFIPSTRVPINQPLTHHAQDMSCNEDDEDDNKEDCHHTISVDNSDDEIYFNNGNESDGDDNDRDSRVSSSSENQLGSQECDDIMPTTDDRDISFRYRQKLTDSTNVNKISDCQPAPFPGKEMTSHLKRLENLVVKNDTEHFNKDEFFSAKTQILKSSHFPSDDKCSDQEAFEDNCDNTDHNDVTLSKTCNEKRSLSINDCSSPKLPTPHHQHFTSNSVASHFKTHQELDSISSYSQTIALHLHNQQQQRQQQQQQHLYSLHHHPSSLHRHPQQLHLHNNGHHPHHHDYREQQKHKRYLTDDISTKSAFKPIIKNWLSEVSKCSNPAKIPTMGEQNNFHLNPARLPYNYHPNTVLFSKSNSTRLDQSPNTIVSPNLHNLDAISLLRDNSTIYHKPQPKSNIPFVPHISQNSPPSMNSWLAWNMTQDSTPSPPKKPHIAPRYHCESCNKTYSTFGGLSKHRQFHCLQHVKKEFGCKFCSKSYSSLGALKMHIRTHTLPCKCHVCGKAFSRPWLLQGHVRTHTGEKPFGCNQCGRAFADRSNLRAHLQTHEEIKKYACVKCGKTFSRMSLLNKHCDGSCPANTAMANV